MNELWKYAKKKTTKAMYGMIQLTYSVSRKGKFIEEEWRLVVGVQGPGKGEYG